MRKSRRTKCYVSNSRLLSKEKRDVAKGAFLTALEQLGTPIHELLDREGLSGEAAKGLGAPSAAQTVADLLRAAAGL